MSPAITSRPLPVHLTSYIGYIVTPHRRPHTVLDAGYCYRRCSVICLSVCVLGYTGESCRNGGTDRDAVWHVDSGGPGPRNCVLHEAPDLHTGWDNFWIFNPLKKWQLPAAQQNSPLFSLAAILPTGRCHIFSLEKSASPVIQPVPRLLWRNVLLPRAHKTVIHNR